MYYMKGKPNEEIREVDVNDIKSNLVDNIGDSMILFKLKTTYIDPEKANNKGYGRNL